MGVYNKIRVNKRKKIPKKFLFIILTIFIIINTFIYIFDKNVLPAVMQLAEIKMKNEATDILYTTCLDVYSEKFDYKKMINIEKDDKGSITLVQADTAELNKLSSQMVTDCNKKINELSELGVSVPIGFMTNNSVIYRLGPSVKIKMSQVGNITTKYESVFESAGINQTRHKIYLNVKATIRVVVPLRSKDIEIECQVPISETIIVGETPQTAINLGEAKQ